MSEEPTSQILGCLYSGYHALLHFNVFLRWAASAYLRSLHVCLFIGQIFTTLLPKIFTKCFHVILFEPHNYSLTQEGNTVQITDEKTDVRRLSDLSNI